MAIDGTYNVTIETPMGAQTGTIIVKDEGGTLKGTFQSPRGSQDFTGTADGEKAKWSLTVPSPMGGEITLTYDCTITATELTGSVQLGQFGTAPIKGTRV